MGASFSRGFFDVGIHLLRPPDRGDFVRSAVYYTFIIIFYKGLNLSLDRRSVTEAALSHRNIYQPYFILFFSYSYPDFLIVGSKASFL